MMSSHLKEGARTMREPHSGEQLEASRRRRFWGVIAGLAAFGAATGFVAGVTAALNDQKPWEFFSSISPGLVAALVALSVIAFGYGTWRFAKVIDEVEMADNLWASTAAYYAYAVLFPAWWVLAAGNVVAAPNHWAIFFIALAAGVVVYASRKWRAR